jgi:hypothetical protein
MAFLFPLYDSPVLPLIREDTQPATLPRAHSRRVEQEAFAEIRLRLPISFTAAGGGEVEKS